MRISGTCLADPVPGGHWNTEPAPIRIGAIRRPDPAVATARKISKRAKSPLATRNNNCFIWRLVTPHCHALPRQAMHGFTKINTPSHGWRVSAMTGRDPCSEPKGALIFASPFGSGTGPEAPSYRKSRVGTLIP